MEEPRNSDQREIPFQVVAIEFSKRLDLAVLGGERPHHAHAGQVLLNPRRDPRESLLDLLEAPVDRSAEAADRD